jgi:folylpolyglutamate synthase/dihydropteroate synthase
MRYLLLLFLFVLPAAVLAQDSSAYELQRNKINALLSQRSARFGQYQQSLGSRTGIFGMQTKKDIKNSNEILRQIALNDNNIFRELKILMEYKEMQVQQVQSTAMANSERIQRYTQAIKKLQDRNESLKLVVAESERQQSFLHYVIGCLALLFFVTVIIMYGKIRKLKKV